MDLSDPGAGNGISQGGSGYAQMSAPQPQPVNSAPMLMQQQAAAANNPSRIAMLVAQLQNNAARGASQISDKTQRAPSTPMDALAQIGRAYDGSNMQAQGQMQDPNSGFWSPTVTPGG